MRVPPAGRRTRQCSPRGKGYDPTFYEQQSAATLPGVPLPPNASIEVSVSSGSAIIYGATIDKVTNDPSIQFARVVFAVL